MKKFLISFLCGLLILNGIVPIYAEEPLTSDTTYTESFEIDGISYDVTIENNQSTVKVTEKKETYVIEYDGNEQTLYIDGEDCSDQIQFNHVYESKGIRRISGQNPPAKYYFDVNPSSVSKIVGTIIAIASIATAATTSGLSLAVFGTGIDYFFQAQNVGNCLSSWYPNASVNGFYQFAQAYNDTKRRNLNRHLYIRVGYNQGYKIYNYGDGAWFDTVKP